MSDVSARWAVREVEEEGEKVGEGLRRRLEPSRSAGEWAQREGERDKLALL